jgi:hypothetical protein
MSNSNLYLEDFQSWTAEQAALLRAGQKDQLDTAHIALEIEGMSRQEKREWLAGLTALLADLLKWQRDSGARSAPRRLSIIDQREALAALVQNNASLGRELPGAINIAFRRARRRAATELGRPETAFPTNCPWAYEKIMDEHFLPNWG